LYLYFVDINHNIVGNPNLLSESSDNFNLILSRNRKHGKNSLFHWQVNAYHNQFKNLITLAAINTIEYTYVNIGKSIVRGLNSELGVDFGRFEFQYRNAVISSSNNLGVNGIPDYFTTINHNFNGTFKLIPKKNVRINAFINRFGKTPSVNYDNNQAILVHTDAFWMIDFSALMPFKIKSSLLNLTCGMRNLANVSNIRTGLSNGIAHQSSTGQRIISTGRTLFFGLEFIL
ncbi:MAG: TonB-dependent receptor, partial [Bacteroidetes bacterium]|nr:TonB-dependent receptor [Bacteroidota bacterium]